MINNVYSLGINLLRKKFDKIKLLCYNMLTLKRMGLRFATEGYILLFGGVEI